MTCNYIAGGLHHLTDLLTATDLLPICGEHTNYNFIALFSPVYTVMMSPASPFQTWSILLPLTFKKNSSGVLMMLYLLRFVAQGLPMHVSTEAKQHVSVFWYALVMLQFWWKTMSIPSKQMPINTSAPKAKHVQYRNRVETT